MVKIAFYKGRGDIIDSVIRWRTHSHVSHCEMVVDDVCYSSSQRDGGVRAKQIDLGNGKWLVLAVPLTRPDTVMSLFENTRGDRYDWKGAVVGQGLAARAHDAGKWFCSEWCACAMGFPESWRYSPGLLLSVIRGQYGY